MSTDRVPEGWPYRWTPAEITAAQAQQRRDQPGLLALVDALRAAGGSPTLVWRCPTDRHCTLFEVWRHLGGGFIVYRGRQPKRSARVMKKALLTEQGGRLAADLDVLEVASRGGLVAHLAACQHLDVDVLTEDLRADLAAGRQVRAVDHEVGHLGAVMGPLTARPDEDTPVFPGGHVGE